MARRRPVGQIAFGQGYVVHGIKRRSSSFNTPLVDDIYVDPHEQETCFFLHYGDLTDANLIRLLQEGSTILPLKAHE